MNALLIKVLTHGILPLVALLVLSLPAWPEEPRINQVQVIGTHNSYHIEPHPTIMKMINAAGRQGAGIEYTHRPLATQFSQFGIRQIELDVRADPDGGRYANPKGLQLAAEKGDHRPPSRR